MWVSPSFASHLSTWLTPSHCFSTHSDHALNLPCIIASATHSRRHALVASVAVSSSSHYFSSLQAITVYEGRQDQANRRARQARQALQHRPATRSITAILTQVTLASTTANATTTMSGSRIVSLDRCHRLVGVCRRELRQLYTHLE
jgi:hypothetical protein